jgi:hypothetical protein
MITPRGSKGIALIKGFAIDGYYKVTSKQNRWSEVHVFVG